MNTNTQSRTNAYLQSLISRMEEVDAENSTSHVPIVDLLGELPEETEAATRHALVAEMGEAVAWMREEESDGNSEGWEAARKKFHRTLCNWFRAMPKAA